MDNPILILKHLMQAASLASSPRERADEIVARLVSAMEVEVCSLYVKDTKGGLLLVANQGLKAGSVGAIRLGPAEGLVGHIAETRQPLNLESASAHPGFRFFPDSGEDLYEGFLGVPVVHDGELTGVLVVEQIERRKFSEDEESFLVTVAAHLGALEAADLLPGSNDLPGGGVSQGTRRFQGASGAPGVGIGRIVQLTAGSDLMSEPDGIGEDSAAELDRYRQAVANTLAELASSQRQIADTVSRDLAEVFAFYSTLLQGKEFCRGVERRIEEGRTAPAALRAAVSDYAERFEAMEDEYFRSRGEDIRNLGSRVYRHLCAPPQLNVGAGEKIVLAGHLISVADIAAHPAGELAGVVSLDGSSLSHTALLAKALGIPAVMGIGRQAALATGETAIIDGYHGSVLVSPSPHVQEEFTRLIDSERHFLEKLTQLKEEPAVTPDGKRVRLLANTGLLADISPGLAQGAEGVGLYRSEIPFMVRESFPTEDEQVEVYRTVLQAYRGMPVSMRTLDIGGDKPLPYFPLVEENPALGWRGIRFTLDNSAVFMTQIRAMLRASIGLENLHIMLPMVSSVAEVDEFAGLLESTWAQLRGPGMEIPRPRVGIMAEVPAVASILPFLKDKIDFISIGSNDLSQYVLAMDRSNPHVSSRCDHLHPAVIETVETMVRRASASRLEVSVCGEMAADPLAVVLLLGMGIESLSMPAFSIPKIKWLIRTVSQTEAREQLETARRCPYPAEIRTGLSRFLESHGLEDLLEPHLPGDGEED